MAVASLSIAVATSYICVRNDCDTGTANLIFIIVLGIEVILYLILMKAIIFQFDKLVAKRKNKKGSESKDIVIESNSVLIEESVHDRIVRERNDLYHFGWNLWNHFKKNRQDQTQECVVSWLKTVFANLTNVELSTIKGKLTIFDSKSMITIQKNIPDYLKFLKE